MPDPNTSFINPYHFLAPADQQATVTRKEAQQTLLPVRSDQREPQPGAHPTHLRHDQYGVGLHSGRIVCRLTTETPCVFGNQHLIRESGKTDGWGSIIRNLMLKNEQKELVPAVSCTSLKGMVSHLLEACSGSAMRVQNNLAMSYRSDYRHEARTAIGMIIEVTERDASGKKVDRRKLLPLTLPQLQVRRNGVEFSVSRERKTGDKFASENSLLTFVRPGEALPWYKYFTQQTTNEIRQSLPFYVDGYNRRVKGKNKRGQPVFKEHKLDAPCQLLKPEILKPETPLSFGHRNQQAYWSVENNTPVRFLPEKTRFILRAENEQQKKRLPSSTSVPSSFGLKVAKVTDADWQNCFHGRGGGAVPLTQKVSSSKETIGEKDARPLGLDEAKGMLLDSESQPAIGILRRLSEPKNGEDLLCPSTKYHEMLIPVNGFFDSESRKFPWEWGKDTPETERPPLHQGLLDVQRQAQDFESQAHYLAELYGDSRPFRLRDTKEKKQRYAKLKLRHGDLVHFRLKQGPVQTWLSDETIPEELPDCTVEVDSLAISCIWRENAQDVYTFLRGAEEEAEQRPMSASRKTITMAEGLFGFVDESEDGGPEGAESSRRLNALAGRLRFSSAIWSREHSDGNEDDAGETWLLSTDGVGGLIDAPAHDGQGSPKKLFPLRILSSPKLPSPEMYFEIRPRADGEASSAKQRLREDGAKHKRWMLAKPEERKKQGLSPVEDRPYPRGFKWYLHDRSSSRLFSGDGQSRYRWQTTATTDNTIKQKALVRPIRSDQSFFFHVDYFNLTDNELAMLQFVLRPSQGFRHKLGFAKPLGLGTVRIDPLAKFVVDRHHRYCNDSVQLGNDSSSRYARIDPWPRLRESESAQSTEAPASSSTECFGAGIFEGDDDGDGASDTDQALTPSLPTTYRREEKAMRDAGTKQQLSASPSAEVPVSDWFWKQLEVLGNPHYVEQLQEQGAHVSYPLMPKQVENWKNGDDIESFRWFSKHLKPLAPLHRDQPTELKELAKKLLLPMYRKIGSAP